MRLLARRAETLGALVVVTYRDSELAATHPVRLAVGELGTAPGVTQLRLPPLSRAAVQQLAGSHGLDAEELYVKTCGNPFFVTEVLAGGGTDVPPTVRDAVLGRMSRLGASAQAALEAVAVVPPRAEIWLLDEVLGDERRARRRVPGGGHAAGRGPRGVVPPRAGAPRGRAVDRAAPARCPAPASARSAARPAGRRSRRTWRSSRITRTRRAMRRRHSNTPRRPRPAPRRRGRTARPPRSTTAHCGSRAACRPPSWPRCSSCTPTSAISRTGSTTPSRAQERALECYRELGDRRREAAALCALSELIWCPGRLAASKRASLDALEALEGLAPGREAALAYLNLAVVAEQTTTPSRLRSAPGLWPRSSATRRCSYGPVSRSRRSAPTAIPARRAGARSKSCSDPRWRAATTRRRVRSGCARPTSRCRTMRIPTSIAIREAGLAFCGERDLEIYARYLLCGPRPGCARACSLGGGEQRCCDRPARSGPFGHSLAERARRRRPGRRETGRARGRASCWSARANAPRSRSSCM